MTILCSCRYNTRMILTLTDPPPPQASPPPGSPSSSKVQQLRSAAPIREEAVTGQLQQQHSRSDLKMTTREVFTGDERKRVCELHVLSVCSTPITNSTLGWRLTNLGGISACINCVTSVCIYKIPPDSKCWDDSMACAPMTIGAMTCPHPDMRQLAETHHLSSPMKQLLCSCELNS